MDKSNNEIPEFFGLILLSHEKGYKKAIDDILKLLENMPLEYGKDIAIKLKEIKYEV